MDLWLKSTRLTSFGVDGAESIVAHFIHKAIEQDRRALLVDPELSLRRVVVGLLDVRASLSAAADTNHPQELVDVCNHRTAISLCMRCSTNLVNKLINVTDLLKGIA